VLAVGHADAFAVAEKDKGGAVVGVRFGEFFAKNGSCGYGFQVAEMDTDAPEDEFLKWYDYCLELRLLGVESTPNFRNWLKGCPRKSESEMEELRQAHQRVEDAKRILEELITCMK
jgi:transcription elongation factor Elf1